MEPKQKRRRYQKDLAPADDIITLIHLVRQNPALYNYKLQPNQRKRIDILNGWAQIACQIGNKYTVEECRRKWKNLRDTYHQYRLRKSKIGDGLSKWRYAKHMDFLSNIYQPKLKSNRTQAYSDVINVAENHLLRDEDTSEKNDEEEDHVVSEDIAHSSILSVNDTDSFILATYDDVSPDNEVTNEDPNMVSNRDNTLEECIELIKHERTTSLDDDGPNGGEADYEEVCLYEDAGNVQSVDCETIANTGGNSADSEDAKYQYIDANGFCMANIQNITTRSHYSSSSSSMIGASVNAKLKNSTASTSQNANIVLTTPPPSTSLDSNSSIISVTTATINEGRVSLPELTSSSTIMNATINTFASSTATTQSTESITLIGHGLKVNSGIDHSSIQTQAASIAAPAISTTIYESAHEREECDLFFDFLKKKIQKFAPEDITSIQVEFLNCVLRREAANAQKIINQQQQQVTSNASNINNINKSICNDSNNNTNI